MLEGRALSLCYAPVYIFVQKLNGKGKVGPKTLTVGAHVPLFGGAIVRSCQKFSATLARILSSRKFLGEDYHSHALVSRYANYSDRMKIPRDPNVTRI